MFLNLSLNLNYADLVIGVIVVLGFIKGFLAGFWSSVLNVAGMFASFIGAYFLTNPVVNYLERVGGWVTRVTGWWADVFSSSQALQPYDPNAVAEFSRVSIPLVARAYFSPHRIVFKSGCCRSRRVVPSCHHDGQILVAGWCSSFWRCSEQYGP